MEKIDFEDPTKKMLEELLPSGLKFKHWYFGHFHIDAAIDSRFTAVYDKVLEIT